MVSARDEHAGADKGEGRVADTDGDGDTESLI
jgi:hypothetical protein